MGKTRLLIYALLALVAVDAVLDALAAWRGAFPSTVPLGSPTAYRNIYLHIPMAWTSLALFTVAFIAAILYLWRGDEKYDRMVRGFAAVALIYSAATLVTGSAWAAESWEGIHVGFSWTWDPRETSVLLLFLAYLAYFVIRASIPDPDRAATLANTYAVAAYAMVPLVFIAPGMASASLHPSFRAAAQFMRESNVIGLFMAKVVVVMAIGFLLAVLASSKGLPREDARLARLALAGFAAYTVLAALLLASPYFTAKLGYVIDANLTRNGEIVSLVVEPLGGGRREVVRLPEPVPSPIKPAFTRVQGAGNVSETIPTINKHIVELGPLREGRVVIVTHWSVALSLALDGVMVLAGYLVAERLARSNEGA